MCCFDPATGLEPIGNPVLVQHSGDIQEIERVVGYSVFLTGGEILFSGKPEDLIREKRSYTAPFLKKELELVKQLS